MLGHQLHGSNSAAELLSVMLSTHLVLGPQQNVMVSQDEFVEIFIKMFEFTRIPEHKIIRYIYIYYNYY